MSNGSKLWLVVLVAACLALAIAVPAFAAVGDTGYVSWASASTLPGNLGTGGPHDGFSTTTVKCAVCHAVHNANLAGQVLLRDNVANACSFCHVDLAMAPITQVYDGNVQNYAAPAGVGGDWNRGHNSTVNLGVENGVTCSKCHQVHAADNQMTANGYLQSKMLIGAALFAPGEYDANAGAPLSGDTSNTALTKWCTRCHYVGLGTPYPYYRQSAYNGQSHIMTIAHSSYTNANANYTKQVAWRDSTQCSSCHASEYTTSAWPHYTDGVRFLVTSSNASATSQAATTSEQDGVCLRCHRDNTGSGINMTF